MVVERLDQLDQALARIVLHRHGVLRPPHEAGGGRGPQFGVEGVAHRDEAVQARQEFMHLVGRDHLVGAGVERELEHRVVASLVLRVDDLADMAEQEGDRIVRHHLAAELREGRAHIGAGAVAVVGQRLDDQRHAAGPAAFVAHLVVVLRVAALALLDRALDIVLGHRLRLGGEDRGAQARIVVGVRQARFRRHGDLAAELGEELGALLVLLALAEHDVLELGMAGHGRLAKSAGEIAGGGPQFQGRTAQDTGAGDLKWRHSKRFGGSNRTDMR